ncbi:MAG: polysaccharide biosynthesis C-terminal domain-containing protein [Bacteroidales bacterium]
MWLAPKRNINNIAGLQVFNILRFVTFLIISIVFTKIGLSKEQIGLFEVSVFMASVATFFWVTGLIQSFLSLYRENKTFGRQSQDDYSKSPEIFNIYLLLLIFSIAVFFIGLAVQNNFSVFGIKGKAPLLNVTLWYILLSSPACLVEYIYMVQNKSGNTISYAYITYTFQLIAVLLPVLLGYDVIWALRGLVSVSIIRNIWLLTLIYNYAEIKLSFSYMKEILLLSTPLIFSTLISGSAQYIDGVVISTHYSADGFAIFRYGAKELPFVVMLAAGLSSAMLTEFSTKKKVLESLSVLKKKSLRIMHSMYPLTIVMLLFAKPIYRFVFSEEFTRSADVFVVYLLAIASRLVFPHTILIGLKKTRTILYVSIFEVVINLFLSLWFVEKYGVTGVAVATIITYFMTKVILVAYNYFKLGIKPQEYIPLKWYVFYSSVLLILFILIDHQVIAIK